MRITEKRWGKQSKLCCNYTQTSDGSFESWTAMSSKDGSRFLAALLPKTCQGREKGLVDAIFCVQVLSKKVAPSLVEGVTCHFFKGNAALDEPQFLLSQVQYKTHDGKTATCGAWDVLKLSSGKEEQFKPGKVISVPGEDKAEILSARLIVVPIYSIQSREKVSELIDRARQAAQGQSKKEGIHEQR